MRWRSGSRSTVRSGPPRGAPSKNRSNSKRPAATSPMARPSSLTASRCGWPTCSRRATTTTQPSRPLARVAALCADRPGKVIVVSNEVGSGIVPADDFLSRRYRDLLGRVNMVFAERAEDAFLVVAGRVLPLLPMKPAIQ